MGSLGKEEDARAMNAAALLPSSPTTGDHLPAEVHSPACVACVNTMACSMLSEHARAGLDSTSPSSSMADLMLTNGFGLSASPASSNSTSFPGTYTVRADMHSSSSTSEYEVGAVAPLSVAPNGHNFPYASLPAPFSLHSAVSESGLSRHAFMCNYLSTLLPALRRIHNQSVSRSFNDKLSAVKRATDMSLAVSVGSSNTWSRALMKEVESSSACMSRSHLPKMRSKRKPERKRYVSRSSGFTAVGKRGRGRSIMHAWLVEKGNYVARTDGSSISSPSADYLSDCSDGVEHFPQWTTRPKKARQAWSHCLSLNKSRHRSGLSRYLRILRSTRIKKQRRSNKASSFTHDSGNRASSSVITKEHIESLGGLVPGGRNMDVPLLLQEAADYILSLQMQVEALQSLSQFVPS